MYAWDIFHIKSGVIFLTPKYLLYKSCLREFYIKLQIYSIVFHTINNSKFISWEPWNTETLNMSIIKQAVYAILRVNEAGPKYWLLYALVGLRIGPKSLRVQHMVVQA